MGLQTIIDEGGIKMRYLTDADTGDAKLEAQRWRGEDLNAHQTNWNARRCRRQAFRTQESSKASLETVIGGHNDLQG